MAYAKNNSGIYAIINTSNGKRYVGSAVKIKAALAARIVENMGVE